MQLSWHRGGPIHRDEQRWACCGESRSDADRDHSLLPVGDPLAAGNILADVPQLEALGDFGGETLTMRPLPSAPAVDAGGLPATSPDTDQRSEQRVTGAAIDLGSVELNVDEAGAAPTPTVPAPEF